MNFHHQQISKPLVWGSDHIVELIIENPTLLRETVSDFSGNSDEKRVSFTDLKGRVLNFEKEIDFIVNPMKLDFSNRRATASLIKLLARASISEDFYMPTNKLKAKIIQHINRLVESENFVFEVCTDDFSMENIAKAIGVRVVNDEDDFIELLSDYMSMMAELADIKVFVFLNLRQYITAEELQQLIKNANNHELDIMLLEGVASEKVEGVNRVVIDRDLCEI